MRVVLRNYFKLVGITSDVKKSQNLASVNKESKNQQKTGIQINRVVLTDYFKTSVLVMLINH